MVKVFISYSHKDEWWKDRLIEQLGVLQNEGLLAVWEDRQIEAGNEWLGEIEGALGSANVAVLLITASFLNSKFILGKEVPLLLKRRQNEGVRVVPLIVKPCPWKEVNWLKAIQARPRDGKPLSKMKRPDADQTLADFATEIIKMAKRGGPSKKGEEAEGIGPVPPEKIMTAKLPVTGHELSGRQHDVFISYSSDDKKVADAICTMFERNNISCWIAPRDMLPGVKYGEAIVTAIEECAVLVVVFSAQANTSDHVHREVERAVSNGKILLPFMIENTKLSKAMEYALSDTHWLDAVTPPLVQHIDRLCKVLCALLGLDSPKDESENSIDTTSAKTSVPDEDEESTDFAIPGEISSDDVQSGSQSYNAAEKSVVPYRDTELPFQRSDIIKLGNYLLSRGFSEGADRIHFFAGKNHVVAKAGNTVVFTMDLHETILPDLLARYKLMANLPWNVNDQFQQGHISVLVGGKHLDITFMAIPGIEGDDCWLQFWPIQ